MRALQGIGQHRSKGSPDATVETQGLVSWMLGLLSEWRGDRVAQRRQLKLVETLALGGKRQLMLVTCGGERFLIGGGPESVEAIVRLNGEALVDDAAEILGESCR
jgi:flagellar biogenesis protein FliO